MSSCHQSCVTCSGQDEVSCTSCNSTSFLALQDIDKGYCISCSVETSVNGYVGIERCLRCTLPSSTDTKPTCLECSELDYMVSIDGRSCVTSCGVGALPNYYTRQCACTNGYGLNRGDRAQGCVPCKVSRCSLCTANADLCNECEIPFGLSLDSQKCLAIGGCPANCVCVNDGTDLGTTCNSCEKNYFLQPVGRICLHSCPLGYALNPTTNNCDMCSANCYSCEEALETRCTSCISGYVIQRLNSDIPTTGRCIAECAEAAVGSCIECQAILGSAKYCSRCASAFFPLDGKCVSVPDQQPLLCISADRGVCFKCAVGYFLHQGGCYSSLYEPGKSVCAAAERTNPAAYGTCRACTHSYHRTSDGICISCTMEGCFQCSSSPDVCTSCSNGYYSTTISSSADEVRCNRCATGCLVCTDSSPSTCSQCAPGYFGPNSVYGCIRCDDSTVSGNLKGIKGCKQCQLSSSGASVICLDDNPDSSFTLPPLDTNKTTLVLSIVLPIIILILASSIIAVVIVLVRRKKAKRLSPSIASVALNTVISG